ncbi:A24 family peptidase [Tundrisphaera sp. TA3]|uniref:A24 family peptidase n=1 Tax=Tundrisphaera sp. TA3 TaxID=3435775 RepID=UPI003EC09FAC
MIRPESLPLFAVAAATIVAAATDLRRFKVYNVLTLPMLAAGLVASGWSGGLGGLGSSLLGAMVGLSVLAAFFAMGGVGAGDVKLFAAMGAWLGAWPTLQVFAASALAAGAYALALTAIGQGAGAASVELADLGRRMISPGRWSRPTARVADEALRPDRRRRLVPFAAATCLGFFAMIAVWHHDGSRVATPSGPAPTSALVAWGDAR